MGLRQPHADMRLRRQQRVRARYARTVMSVAVSLPDSELGGGTGQIHRWGDAGKCACKSCVYAVVRRCCCCG